MLCGCCIKESQHDGDQVIDVITSDSPSALPPGEVAPTRTPTSIGVQRKLTLHLKKDATIEGGSKLGVTVIQAESGMVITTLENGLVENYNKLAAPEQRIYPGDRIVAVSGASDMDGIVEKLREPVEVWTLDVQAMRTWEVVLTKPDEAEMGLVLGWRSGVLAVTAVKDSSITAEHNKANPDAPIKAGMRIVSLNDIRTTPEMVQEIKVASTVRFLMREGVPLPAKFQPGSPLASPR
mmetsp:Transcript_15590/g.41306  ORF Transcript_15590/g.41306 Transcript_15590/m.41306 type:complete len:237 (-) Transcript_15590:142-852(-)